METLTPFEKAEKLAVDLGEGITLIAYLQKITSILEMCKKNPESPEYKMAEMSLEAILATIDEKDPVYN